jgi:hypothetical protein
MTDILQAARSYYGMDSTPVGKCEIYTNEHGSMRLVIEIPVTGSDFIAIAERMKAMQEAESQQTDLLNVPYPVPNNDELRKAYNALSKEERGRYGSFSRFVAEASNYIMQVEDEFINGTSNIKNPVGLMGSMGAEGRKVAHIDAPEIEEPTSMGAVWLWKEDTTAAQQQFASDNRHAQREGEWFLQYLVPWSMLTEEQRQKAKESGK